jgi:hypothetical protein
MGTAWDEFFNGYQKTNADLDTYARSYLAQRQARGQKVYNSVADVYNACIRISERLLAAGYSEDDSANKLVELLKRNGGYMVNPEKVFVSTPDGGIGSMDDSQVRIPQNKAMLAAHFDDVLKELDRLIGR